jgi:predicted membrane channel-forming protein YqfA (hemolysin III family)
MRSSNRSLLFILFLVFGLYFLNYGFSFIPLPKAMDSINKWIITAGGVLILLGGINYLRASRYTVRY